jgi:Rod binding domain-containing protein
MEVMMTTFMIKTMDESGTEGGLLGKTSQGMGYFKDQFFQSMAEEVVSQRGLGFVESLRNTYNSKKLTP